MPEHLSQLLSPTLDPKVVDAISKSIREISLLDTQLKLLQREQKTIEKEATEERARLLTINLKAQEALSRQIRDKLADISKARRENRVSGLESFANLPDLESQYSSQVEIFKALAITQTLSTGQEGIVGIDQQKYPVPTYEEVLEHLNQNRALVERKAQQNLKVLILVPFARDFKDLAQVYADQLLKHYRAGNLFATKQDPSDQAEALIPLDLNVNKPLWKWDKYDIVNDPHTPKPDQFVYFPKRFDSQGHEGLTKAELLQGQLPSAYQKDLARPTFVPLNKGWQILLVEDLPNIPRAGEEKAFGGRTQINTAGEPIRNFMETGATIPNPHEYLASIQGATQGEYQDEIPLTPEANLLYAILHLEATNQVVDDYDRSKGAHGSASYSLGAYQPSSGSVPYADFDRGNQQAYLSRDDPGNRYGNSGFRSAVRVYP